VLIDWFTVVAQIINFLVLMVLLKVFLYDRVIQAMDEREQKIASRLEEADRKQHEADERREKLEAEQQDIDQKREKLLSDAKQKAREKREALEQSAREEVDALKDRWTAALQEKKAALARSVQEKAARQVFNVVRRVLEDMAEEDFQERLIRTFMTRLRRMEAEDKQDLAESLDQKQPAAALLSSFEVSTTQRQKMTRLLREEIHPDLEIDYQTDGDLLGGIELRIPGKKVPWTPRQYLEDLEENVLEALGQETHGNEKDSTADAGAGEKKADG
jgi:F-type H+-transporting ATPase subunit b